MGEGEQDGSGGPALQSPSQTRNDLEPDVARRYEAAIPLIGRKFLSSKMAGFPPPDTTAGRREAWKEDHAAYMSEVGLQTKIPKIGGGALDLYALFVEVVERGGIQNVIEHREFKMIGRILSLPSSCTSAAFVLRVSYINILYPYEQKLVWDRTLDEAPRVVPLKESQGVGKSDGDPDCETSDLDAIENAPEAALPAVQKEQKPATPSKHLPPAPAAAPGAMTKAPMPAWQAAAAKQPIPTQSLPATPTPAQIPPKPIKRPPPRRTPVNPPVAKSGMPPPPPTIPVSPSLSDEATAQFRKKSTAPIVYFNTDDAKARAKLALCLQCEIKEEVAWALGTLQALTFDVRREFWITHYPGVLNALTQILRELLEDLILERQYGYFVEQEESNLKRPRITLMAGLEFLDQRSGMRLPGSEVFLDDGESGNYGLGRVRTLQEGKNLFNCDDSLSRERIERSIAASNALRNMSIIERNGPPMASHSTSLKIMWHVMSNCDVPKQIKDNLFDVWLNISMHFHVADESPCAMILSAVLSLLDPLTENAEDSLRALEILGFLSANADKNETALVSRFDDFLPSAVDYLSSKTLKFSTSALAVICNVSSFDWPARAKIAQTRHLVGRLVNLLSNPDLASRAALTLLNLSEAPNNRKTLMEYEADILCMTVTNCVGADTLAAVLSELSSE